MGGGNEKREDLDARVHGGGMQRFCDSSQASQKDSEKEAETEGVNIQGLRQVDFGEGCGVGMGIMTATSKSGYRGALRRVSTGTCVSLVLLGEAHAWD